MDISASTGSRVAEKVIELAEQSTAQPVFVMGLPRSGSTLLSRILNFSPEILSVNDLYFLQGVFAEDVEDRILSVPQVKHLSDLLLKVIDTRANANDEFIGQFQISPEKIEEIRGRVLDGHNKQEMRWFELMDFILSSVAFEAGKSKWADKTPQNFYHFNLIARRFPNARFIFLFRDPRYILASYKYASGDGHDSRRYHPLIYALYWRSAVRFFMRLGHDSRVLMVRYEDLLTSASTVCSKLSDFLSTSIEQTDLSSLGHNSSFGGRGRRTITSTEAWLCQKVCHLEMQRLGYKPDDVRPRLSHLPELLIISARFLAFQLWRVASDGDSRQRIRTYISGLRG